MSGSIVPLFKLDRGSRYFDSHFENGAFYLNIIASINSVIGKTENVNRSIYGNPYTVVHYTKDDGEVGLS